MCCGCIFNPNLCGFFSCSSSNSSFIQEKVLKIVSKCSNPVKFSAECTCFCRYCLSSGMHRRDFSHLVYQQHNLKGDHFAQWKMESDVLIVKMLIQLHSCTEVSCCSKVHPGDQDFSRCIGLLQGFLVQLAFLLPV